MKILWSDRARNDYAEILAYVERDSLRASKRVAQTLISTVDGLIAFPQRGRIGQVPGTRELVFPSLPYIVVYRLSDEQVEILRVLHGAQLWP